MTQSVATRIDGRLLQGTFTVDAGRVTVSYRGRTMARELGSRAPKQVAEHVLQQLARLVEDLVHAA